MILLAEAAQPNANTVWLVILAVSALGGNLATIGLWRATWRRQETAISPQPLIVAMEEKFVGKAEFEKQKDHCTERHGQLFKTIDRVERGAGNEIESKVEVVRKDVHEVGKKVAGLEATTVLQNQQLASIQSDIKRLLERRSS